MKSTLISGAVALLASTGLVNAASIYSIDSDGSIPDNPYSDRAALPLTI